MRIRKRALSVGLAASIALGGAVALAPAANAVGSSKCNIKDALPGGVWETSASNVNLRSGPSTSYSSKGQLKKGTDFTYHCTYKVGNRKGLWYYGTVRQGAHKGTKGWIFWQYAHIAQ
ncbi:SH3 domain-containing protein [Streptomyces sp. CA-146814]|uniref:SH3 domain-containing protein n=1 Tax=Streptomyces sp. CA-146814 TaxID=3240053 RepID=UPI003D94CAC2